jgi:hypothetical protein
MRKHIQLYLLECGGETGINVSSAEHKLLRRVLYEKCCMNWSRWWDDGRTDERKHGIWIYTRQQLDLIVEGGVYGLIRLR